MCRVIDELHLTPDELRAVIGFLTEVGHPSDARRQEWVLLADVGVSTLVEDRCSPCTAGATPQVLPGPLYRADVPEPSDGADLSRDDLGERLGVTRGVRDGSGAPLPG